MDLLIHKLVEEYEPHELREKLKNIKKELTSEDFMNFLHFNKKFTMADAHKFKYEVNPILFYKYCTIEKIEVLLDFGLDINMKNHSGKNSLFYVDAEKCDFLLKKGIEKQIFPNNERVNPLFSANLEKLKVLLSHGYDINIKNLKEETIMFAAPNIDVVDFLITKGFSINDTNNAGDNMIMGNTSNHHMIKDLIERGLNINHLNDRKQNALFRSSLKKMKVLLECDINIHQLSKSGTNCAFHNSFSYNKGEPLDKLKLLKEAGVDLTIEDNRGKNILDYVKSNDEIEFLLLQGIRVPDYGRKSYMSSANIEKIKMIEEVQMKIAIDKEKELLLSVLKDDISETSILKRRI